MTKEQFLRKWGWLVLQDEKEILSDLVAVISTEIAKAQEKPQPEKLKGNCTTFDMSRLVDREYRPAEQSSSQAKLDNSFDKDRFERMFRAVLAHHGSGLFYSQVIQIAEEALTKLDAYYASKNN